MEEPALHCPRCAYNLTGIPEDRCPECGYGYTHAALQVLARWDGGERLWTARRVLACALLSAGGSVCAVSEVVVDDVGLRAVCLGAVLAACWWGARRCSTALPGSLFDSGTRSMVLALLLGMFCLPLFMIIPAASLWWAAAGAVLAWVFMVSHPLGLPESIQSLPEPQRRYVLRHARGAWWALWGASGLAAIIGTLL